MLMEGAKIVVLPLKILAHQIIAKERARVNDGAFIKD
jgi:hypothetical protein